MAVQYDKKRSGDLQLEKGDLVLVESTNRSLQVGGKVAKLCARYNGPYKVLDVINGGRDT